MSSPAGARWKGGECERGEGRGREGRGGEGRGGEGMVRIPLYSAHPRTVLRLVRVAGMVGKTVNADRAWLKETLFCVVWVTPCVQEHCE